MKLLRMILCFLFWNLAQTQNCSNQCRKCNLEKQTCAFCDLTNNSILEEPKCVLLQYPGCVAYWPDERCIQCKDTHFLKNKQCELRSEIDKVENCLSYELQGCVQCIENFQLINGKCVAIENEIEGCSIYAKDQKNSCQSCKSGFMLTRDKNLCLEIDSSENCHMYSYVECTECSPGYHFNQNFYLKQFFNFSSQSDRAYFASFQYQNQLQKINQCELIVVENCKVLANESTCSVCNSGFFLRQGQCITYPKQKIINCKVYSLGKECLSCNQGYFLSSPTSCKSVTSLNNCIEYNGSASITECVRCNSEHFLNDGICLKRNDLEKNNNCALHQATSELCQKCATGYQITNDFKSCLKDIPNCLTYADSTEASKEHSCSQCQSGMTFILSTLTCSNGTVSNCLNYKNNDECKICSPGYYFSKTCQKHDEIKQCVSYSNSTKNICDKCTIQYIPFTQINKCEIYQKIDFCDEYISLNECSKCQDEYTIKIKTAEDTFTSVNRCVPIDKSLNCLQLQGAENCVLCKPEAVNNGSGKCLKTVDYISGLCDKHNLDGKIQFESFTCSQCVANSIPFYSESYFMCTSKDNISELPANCSKWSYNNITSTFFCSQCSIGYYLNEGNCFTDCSIGDKTIILQSIKKNKALTTNNYVSYKISTFNFCSTDFTISTQNCLKVALNIFSQSTDYNKISYTCVQCKENFLSVVIEKETSNFVSVSLDPDLEGPLVSYPGLSCLTLSIDTVSSSLKDSQNKVPNCEYYYNILRKSTLDSYGCFKCKFGFGGVVVENGITKDYHGFIDRCEAFNENLIEGEGRCDLNVKYQGYTSEPYQLEWNKIPLESYLSCFACQSVLNKDFKPFLFISFEDIEFYNKNEQYETIALQSGARLNFETFTKYNPFNNEMVKQPVLGVNKIQQGKAPFKGSGGKSLMCLNNHPSTFFLENSNYRVLGIDQVNWSKCALFIVNINREFNASESYLENPALSKATIFCGACNPGFKASISEKLRNKNLELKYIPYYVYQCTEIPNCAEGGTWVNNCQKCQNNYTYRWNQILLTIEHNTCLPVSTNFCGAVKDTGECVHCKKGYSMVNDVCEQIIPAFCKEEDTIIEYDFPANVNYVSLARNLLSLRKYTKGCNFCLDGMVAKEVYLTNSTLSNHHKYICMKSGILENKTSISNQFIPNCNNYYNDEDQNLTCTICNLGYIQTTEGLCIASSTQLQNCLQAKENTDGSFKCIQCSQGFIFLNGKCQVGTIDKCIRYQININATYQTCLECLDGHFSKQTSCAKGVLQNCLEYQSEFVCQKCNSEYELVKIKNSTICLKRDAELKCQTLNNTQLQRGILDCDKCDSGCFSKDISQQQISKCMQIDKTENCAEYDINTNFLLATFKCKMCSPQYFLDLKTFSCLQRTKVDPNCQEYSVNSDVCLSCKVGYFVSEKPYLCEINPNGIVGCKKYQEENNCTECTQDYYISNNECILFQEGEKLPECITYANKTTCIECTSLYYVINGECQKTSALNCLTSDSGSACLSCPPGYGIREQNFVSNCVKVENPNCLKWVEVYPFSCLLCHHEYFIFNGLCKKLQNGLIPNCIAYDSETTCQICEKGYFLEIDKQSCSSNLLLNGLKDSNCEKLVLISPSKCVACKVGHYFKQGKCVKSEENGQDKGCDYSNPQKLSQCLLCSTGYYMNILGKCIKVDSIPTQEKEKEKENGEKIEPSKFIGILQLSLSLLLFWQFNFIIICMKE